MFDQNLKTNEKVLRTLINKLKTYTDDDSVIRKIVYTLDDMPEFLEMIEYLDNNNGLTLRDIDRKAVDIAYNSYKGERE